MFSKFLNSLFSLLRSFSQTLGNVLSFVLSPGIFFAQILFYGPKTLFHAKVSERHVALTHSQTFLRKTLLGRFVFTPLLLMLLTAFQILLKVVSILFWPILFVVGKFEHLVPRNGDVRQLTPEMRYHMWLMRRTFWH